MFTVVQDTITALQALAQFAEQQTNRDFSNMNIQLMSTSSPEWSQIFTMSKGDVHGYQTSGVRLLYHNGVIMVTY